MRKNSIDIYTSQHVYPANSFREFPLDRDLILVLFLVKGVNDFMARILPYKQEMENGKAFRVG